MGVIVLFGKANCEYCDKAHSFLQELVAELKASEENWDIKIKIIDCKDGARAAQCIQLTGKRTVPHIFLNDTYLGNASAVLGFNDSAGKRNTLKDKIKAAALVESNFPPVPLAAMVKVTESLAISSQPTSEQVQACLKFGMNSIVNLCDVCTKSSLFEEAEVARRAGVQYFNVPFSSKSIAEFANNSAGSAEDGLGDCRGGCSDFVDQHAESIQAMCTKVFETIDKCKKPTLVHCESGRRACFIVLMHSAKAMKASTSKVSEWSVGLGHDFRVLPNAKRKNKKPSYKKRGCVSSSDGPDWMSYFLERSQADERVASLSTHK